MKAGIIGLGKMGYNIGLQMLDKHHDVVAYDLSEEFRESFKGDGGGTASSLQELVDQLPKPRIIWVMVPAGDATDQVLTETASYLDEGDILIDAGNSHYKRTLAHYEALEARGVHFFDVGTSGGISGARNGACLMIGGRKDVFPVLEPLMEDLSVENGYHYTGEGGSAHYLKMVHNGIEYGMMAAMGEGFELLEKGPFDYDYEQVARVWNNGSVIRGWLMELMEEAFRGDARLDDIRGVMHSSGEGKWSVESALEYEATTPVIALSLMMRYRSQETDTFNGKVVAALRKGFGGHAVEKSE